MEVAGDDNWSVHLLDFQDRKDSDWSTLQSTLKWVYDADVYVSGIGTGMMWAPLARAGAVVVNLAWLSNYGSDTYFYSAHHSLDHMMQDHVRVGPPPSSKQSHIPSNPCAGMADARRTEHDAWEAVAVRCRCASPATCYQNTQIYSQRPRTIAAQCS